MDIKRRELLKFAGLGAAVASASILPTITGISGQAMAGTSNRRVVIIGGGFGGSTVAKYLRLWGNSQVDVVLVDASATYKTPILSNLILNGQKTITNLTINLDTSVRKNGASFVQGKVLGIDRNQVSTNDGRIYNGQVNLLLPDNINRISLPYDKLILSPGIDFDFLPSIVAANSGYTDKTCPIPHAWKSGDQVLNLKAQIDKLPTGGKGVFVLCIPKKPYRCPPGPYERACVVADILKRVKGGGKLIIFDANSPIVANDKYSAIQAETHTFTTAFTGQFASIVEYVPSAELVSVSASGGQFGKKTATVKFPNGSTRTVTCNVLNVLPTHKASQMVFDAKLISHPNTPDPTLPVDRFVPVNLQNYAYSPNNIDDPYIHVIGDSHKSTQPKAGHIANSEAKICADAIIRQFARDGFIDIVDDNVQPENVIPVTNSACYSPITNSTASWLTAGYRFNPQTKAMDRIAESFDEAEMPSSDNYKMMLAWANNLFADTFSI